MKPTTSLLLAALASTALSQEETSTATQSLPTTTTSSAEAPDGSAACAASALSLLAALPTLPAAPASFALTASPDQDPCALTWPASLSSAVLRYESSVAAFVSDRRGELDALVAGCEDLIDGPAGSAICSTEARHVFTGDGTTATEGVGYTVFPALATQLTSGTVTETETETLTQTSATGTETETETETGGEDGDSVAGRAGANVYAVGALVGVLGVAAAL
ncbi:uncharacterized protein VDAG_09587 [Verticillium dahliae VdLs.17]|uniref:Infection structure specific protein n=2 Tax=Verticillium dahliae TaxID=27337 RepID=G2XHT7_VERDV|nr:uncharacterized protein VDAG_09587 [Verticillium dahliae VdLs.17]EGY19385.1 hypothetical protein VDAG_09587 [Verticillium dahliae VdLs.17]KAH6708592.1 hypothetical protein EV126DRAFT_511589 [Verticillium dahliae]PNH29367.1 hypothetical protein BJF96_g7307 [Verticillium dahliae]PNH54533.1 hypothetical protein VD0003_g3009 [Verticillium dahliae]